MSNIKNEILLKFLIIYNLISYNYLKFYIIYKLLFMMSLIRLRFD